MEEESKQFTMPLQNNADAVGDSAFQGKWLVLASLGVGTFMSTLDASIVNASLPAITTALKTEMSTIEWVVMGYLLVISALLLTFGRLGDMIGHKKVYLTGFLFFTVGSALCGLSPSAEALIGFRVFQGLGSSMMMATAPALLTRAFPPSQRGQALGLNATLTYLGLTVGPSLGGLLTQAFGWRYIFYVNIPIGLIGTVSAVVFLRQATIRRTQRFDLAGAAILMMSLSSFLLALSKGQDWGWGSSIVLGLFAFFAVLLIAFLLLERAVAQPMVNLSLFRSRLFSAANASALINYLGVYSIMFLMPFYLIQARGFNPAQSGLALTAMPLTMAVVAPVSGWLSDRIGSRFLSSAGMVILAIGLWLLSGLDLQSGGIDVALRLAVAGFGVGMFVSPNNSSIMGAAPKEGLGIASGMLAMMRNTGMVVGVAVAGAVFAVGSQRYLAMSLGRPQAFVGGFHDALLVAAVITLPGIVLSLSRPRLSPKKAEIKGSVVRD